MKTTFKVGDKLRIKKEYAINDCTGLYSGKVVTVLRVYTSFGIERLEFSEEDGGRGWYSSQFEFTEEQK